MRLATFQDAQGVHLGAVRDHEVVALDGIAPDMLTLIDRGPEALAQASQAAQQARGWRPINSVTLLSPIPRPRQNVVCVGMNYVAHAIESDRARGREPKLPSVPVFFTKAVNSVANPWGDFALDMAVTSELDYEVELAFVIGRTGKNIRREDALSYVFGYTVANDISARDLQSRHQQFFKGKSLDGACPLGPWIVTADEIPDPAALTVRLRVNGEQRQESSVSDLIFDVPTLIEYLSLGATLEAGTIVCTGTPSGVGLGFTPPRYLQVGDVVEAEVDAIGALPHPHRRDIVSHPRPSLGACHRTNFHSGAPSSGRCCLVIAMPPARKILHLDLDAFFCAVEEQRDPTLVGKPFAVGGRPDSRGVVASCSYPARRFGIHSAMPMSQAVRLCSGLIIVPARHGAYSTVSRQVMALLHDLTPLVEQISIDEAFLDVTERPEPAEQLARQLQARIRSELKLPCSLGVGSNKLVAKIANNVGKAGARGDGPPNVIRVVEPGQEAAFVAPLPCDALWGVGPKTAERLRKLEIKTVGDIALRPEAYLIGLFGKNGYEFARHARGLDDRPVVTEHERKSVSQETTFERDVADGEALRRTLRQQSVDVSRILKSKGLWGTTVKVKLRWPNFATITRQVTLPAPANESGLIASTAVEIFDREWDDENNPKAVRLIGVGVSGLRAELGQRTLFDQPNEREERLDAAMQALRARFGPQAIRRASDLED